MEHRTATVKNLKVYLEFFYNMLLLINHSLCRIPKLDIVWNRIRCRMNVLYRCEKFAFNVVCISGDSVSRNILLILYIWSHKCRDSTCFNWSRSSENKGSIYRVPFRRIMLLQCNFFYQLYSRLSFDYL